jgi:hypothetical protein
MKSRSSRKPGVDCRLDGGRQGGGYRCEALGAESISIVITSAIASAGLGARHK